MKEYLHNIKNTQDLISLKNNTNPQTGFANDNHVSTIQNQYIDEVIDYHPITTVSKDTKTDEWLWKNAWGVVIKARASAGDWELIGNRQLWEDFKVGKDTGHPIGRYWLKDDGTARKCDPNDSTKFLDGSPVPNDEGQIMVYLPELYYRVYTMKSGHTVLWMSSKDLGGHKLEASMIGAFLSTDYNDKVYSRISDNIGSFRMNVAYKKAQSVGTHFNIMNYDQWRYIVMLHLSEFGTADIHVTLGYGQLSYKNFVGKTSKYGDNTCYLTSDGTAEERDKTNDGIQNFLGIEGISHKRIFCGGLLNTSEGIYIYKDPLKLYVNKEEITKLDKSEYRFINKRKLETYKKDIYEIIGEEYFDIFSKNQRSYYPTSFSDDQYLDSDYDRVFLLFGDKSDFGYGLLYCEGKVTYDSYFPIRCGYFGPINFIN